MVKHDEHSLEYTQVFEYIIFIANICGAMQPKFRAIVKFEFASNSFIAQNLRFETMPTLNGKSNIFRDCLNRV